MKRFHRIALTSLTLLASVLVMGATTPALVLLHQRSDLASLEADLQNREIGLDFADKTAVGKFADGTKFHLLSQEMPNAALTGTLNVTGNTTLGAALTLSALNPNQPVWTNGSSQAIANAPTGTGTTLVLQTSPSVTTPTVNGAIAFGTAGAAADLSIWRSATSGLSIRGGAGSSYDFALFNPAAQYLMRNPTGTQTVEFAGSLSALTTLNVTGIATFTGAPVFNGGITSIASLAGGFYEEGTFTATMGASGYASPPSGTAQYVRTGKSVTIYLPTLSGTSNATTADTIYTLPASIRPARSMSVTYGAYFDPGTGSKAPTTLTINTVGVMVVNWFNGTTLVTSPTSSGSTEGFTSVGTFTYTQQ